MTSPNVALIEFGLDRPGVFMHVHDTNQFASYAASIEILRAIKRIWPSEFTWLPRLTSMSSNHPRSTYSAAVIDCESPLNVR